jgi:hypothetical protein
MSIDRHETLKRWAIAKRAMHDLDLSDRARAAARQVYHRATVVLGMQDAAERAKAGQPTPRQETPDASSPATSPPQPALPFGGFIDPPSPFAPKSEMRAFLKEWEDGPYKDRPEVRYSVEQVRVALAEAEKRPGHPE